MYIDVLYVQDNVLDLLEKNIEKFSFFFEISQKVKLIDPINVLQTHINMDIAQSLNYNTTLYHQWTRRYKHKGVKLPARKQKPFN